MKSGELTQLQYVLVRGWLWVRPQTFRNCKFKPAVLFTLLALALHANSVCFQLGEQERNWGGKVREDVAHLIHILCRENVLSVSEPATKKMSRVWLWFLRSRLLRDTLGNSRRQRSRGFVFLWIFLKIGHKKKGLDQKQWSNRWRNFRRVF